jgi:hypothetical protein
MTLITLQDGKLVLHDGKIGTQQTCCCDDSTVGSCCTFITEAAGSFGFVDGPTSVALHGQGYFCVTTSYGGVDVTTQENCETCVETQVCQCDHVFETADPCPEGYETLASGEVNTCQRLFTVTDCDDCPGFCSDCVVTRVGGCGAWSDVPECSFDTNSCVGCCCTAGLPDPTKNGAQCDDAGGQWIHLIHSTGQFGMPPAPTPEVRGSLCTYVCCDLSCEFGTKWVCLPNGDFDDENCGLTFVDDPSDCPENPSGGPNAITVTGIIEAAIFNLSGSRGSPLCECINREGIDICQPNPLP